MSFCRPNFYPGLAQIHSPSCWPGCRKAKSWRSCSRSTSARLVGAGVQLAEPRHRQRFAARSLCGRGDRGGPPGAEVEALHQVLLSTEQVMTTGLILQELQQGFAGPKNRELLQNRLSSLPCLQPDRQVYIEAAEARNACRRRGVQVGTIDALFRAC